VTGPFEFDHVAIAARRIGDAEDLVRALGGRSDEGGPSPGFRWWQWIFAGGGRLEVLEPDGPPDGFLHRFLARHGPGIHHVTFEVPDLDTACARAESLGQRVVGYDARHPGWSEAFLHPSAAQGIVVQLVQTASNGAPEAPNPSLAATLVGVRMVARDAALARGLWTGVLGGSCSEAEGGLRFHWPNSPLAISVRIEPGGVDRSEAIEVSGAAAGALPDGLHPLLGTRFAPVRT
jgi:catechol 2,3-dioxygenase-like lactoylglutathione lyase family enzyme